MKAIAPYTRPDATTRRAAIVDDSNHTVWESPGEFSDAASALAVAEERLARMAPAKIKHFTSNGTIYFRDSEGQYGMIADDLDGAEERAKKAIARHEKHLALIRAYRAGETVSDPAALRW